MSRESGGVRERILDAALELLRTQGVRAFSQPQVAKAAGVLQSHLTYYFPRRTDLLAAVVHHSAAATVEEIRASLATQPLFAADADVRERVMALTRFLAKNRERTRMLLALLVETDDEPALRDILVEQVGQVRGLVAMAIGRDHDDPDVDIALAMLWGLGLQHFVLADRRGEDYTDRLFERVPLWFAASPRRDAT